MSRLDETLALTRVRTMLMLRQPEIVFWVFGFPMLLAVVLGFAFRSAAPADNPVGVLGGAGAAELVELLGAEDGLEVEAYEDPEEARVALRGGTIDVLVEPGTPPVLHLDPAQKEAETARLRVLRALELPPPDQREEVATIEPVEEHGSRYIDFLMPGLIGLNLLGTGMWSIGFGIADARQKRLLRRLLVTPMRRSSYLASFMLFRLLFLVIEVGLLTGFGALVLGVPLRGGLLAFGVVCLVGAASYAGLGMLAVSRVKTIEGASGMINLSMIPMWLGSGVFFSYERFPEAVQPVLRALPLTPCNEALRDVMLDGAGLVDVLPDLGIVAVWGVVCFAVALRIFRWD